MKLTLMSGLTAALVAAASQSPTAGPPVPDGGTPDAGLDEQLLREIEAATAPPPSPMAFNPAMSVNGLFLGAFTSQDHPAGEEAHTGVAIQEVELQILASVDPYLSANVILSLEHGEGIGVEEGYLTLTAQPLGIAFRGGKIKVPFGRENLLHTHALPFVDRSLVGQVVFGDGLTEVGIEGSYLLPVPWYLLVTASLLNGDNEAAFHSPDDRDLEGFAALKSVVDLTGDATLELGASYTLGRNADQLLSQAAGAHAVVKWKPAAESTTRSASLTLEGLCSRVPRPGIPNGIGTDTYGLYAYAQWQLERRWYVGGRFEFLRPARVVPTMSRRESAILVFAPTEFSAVRLQASATQPGAGSPPFYEAFLQVNFTLGAHPAHSY